VVFKDKARKLLSQAPNCNPGTTDQELRQALFKFIADFANWDVASNRRWGNRCPINFAAIKPCSI
jgi:putative DNA methylase